MPADVDALNYPYIRIRSADWLKRTLLIFPHVVRIKPLFDAPLDDPEIAVFADHEGIRGPLLRAADTGAAHVYQTQRQLIAELQKRITKEGQGFRSRFGKANTYPYSENATLNNSSVWNRRLAPGASFQIHRDKMFWELADFLEREELAWRPNAEDADGPNYLEMHTQLGEAIMATLATACAENEGLQVVTEFPELHGKLLGVPRESILAACLDGTSPTGRTSGQQIAEFLVYRHCDVEMLSIENIVALKREREALADFRGRLEELALTLPPQIFSERHLQERIQDSLNDMFKEWERDQANLSSTARRFFSSGTLLDTGKLVQKLVESSVKPQTAQGAIQGAAAGGFLGMSMDNLTPSILVGASAGFVVALVFRGFDSWREARDTARKSPLRYLSKMQEQGVSFSIGR